MLQKIYNTEIEYVKKFSKSCEDNEIIRFWDDNIPNMYTHNFLLIKNNLGIDNLKEAILRELVKRKKNGLDFLRVEFNFSIDNDLFDILPLAPQITIYDYMYIDPKMGDKLSGKRCVP